MKIVKLDHTYRRRGKGESIAEVADPINHPYVIENQSWRAKQIRV